MNVTKRGLGWLLRAGLAVLLSLCATGGLGAAEQRAGEAISVRDSGLQRIGDRSAWLANGDAIIQNASVITDRAGSVDIRMDDGSELHIHENSEVTVDDFVYDAGSQDGRSVVSLAKGTLRMISGRMPSRRYRVNTPTAVIGVRGTEFTVALGRNDDLLLQVSDGTVVLRMTASQIEYAFRAPSVALCTPSGCERIDPNDGGRGRGRAGGRGAGGRGGGHGGHGAGGPGGNGAGGAGGPDGGSGGPGGGPGGRG